MIQSPYNRIHYLSQYRNPHLMEVHCLLHLLEIIFSLFHNQPKEKYLLLMHPLNLNKLQLAQREKLGQEGFKNLASLLPHRNDIFMHNKINM